ncbi:MAG: 50S ribosomal protein L10 [archaeon]
MTRHTTEWKKKEVTELKQLIESYPVIAVADITGFPANLFQDIRKLLHDKAVIKVSKTRVILNALKESKLKESKLLEEVKGSVAIIFTQMNPFELYALIKKNKGRVSAKPGIIAPDDILVPAGDTGLPPGPALSDLKGAGLKVRIQGSSIFISEDKTVCRKGEEISKVVSGTLQKLNIKPIKVGLNVIAVYEKGEIFKAEVMDIDIDELFSDFQQAYRNSLNLALNIYYTNEDTIKLFLSKAYRDSLSVALDAEIFNKETISNLLGKANLQADSLKSMVKEPEATKESKEEKKEAKEEKAEEKKEDSKEEKKEDTAFEKSSGAKEEKKPEEDPKKEEKPEEKKGEEKKEIKEKPKVEEKEAKEKPKKEDTAFRKSSGAKEEEPKEEKEKEEKPKMEEKKTGKKEEAKKKPKKEEKPVEKKETKKKEKK